MSEITDLIRLFNCSLEKLEKTQGNISDSIYQKYIRPLQESRILTRDEVKFKLKITGNKLTRLIAEEKIKTTSDGKITEYSLYQYLTNNPNA